MAAPLISLRELSKKIKSEISGEKFPDYLLGDFIDDFASGPSPGKKNWPWLRRNRN